MSLTNISVAKRRSNPRGDRLTVAILAPRSPSSAAGGAERFYVALSETLNSFNFKTDIIEIAAPEHDYTCIARNYLRCYRFDLRSFDRVISTKAPTHACQHDFHVCYLQHLVRAYYDMFDVVFSNPNEQAERERAIIQDLDTRIFAAGRIREVFTISNEVSQRLRKYNGVQSTVLYQGTTFAGSEKIKRQARHVLFVSRLHPWKRPNLAIEAMLESTSKARLVVAGRGEVGDLQRYVHEHSRLRDRVTVIENPTDEELKGLYAEALAVIFPPVGEDFGLITLEAAQYAKPVITCSDSGEPARLVRAFSSGIVCEPTPWSLGRAVDVLWQNPALALRLGRNNNDSLRHFSWQRVGQVLARTLRKSRTSGTSVVSQDSLGQLESLKAET